MKLYWLDLETTGLNPEDDVILEIAVFAADLETPFDARRVYQAVLKFYPAAQRTLSAFILDMHTKNGLLEACAVSTLTPDLVERDLLSIVPFVEDRAERPTLAGSSIHFDHSFLREHMPTLAARFSHRHYDVSAVKLFCRSLGMQKLPRAEAHRAVDDVLESIEHARFCADWLGRLPSPQSSTSSQEQVA